MKKTKIFQICFIGILFLVAGGIYLATSITKAVTSDENTDKLESPLLEEDQTELSEIKLEETSVATTVPNQQMKNNETVSTSSNVEEEKQIIVHVCGCVTQPDVYKLQENARLIDAVEAAKGFTANAACDRINQAQILNDGQRVYIPSKEEIEEGLILEEFAATDSDSAENPLINLNLATKDELMTLPGIGEAKAERILTYRKEHGGFQTIEDIKQIAGVKEAIFLKVKDYITVK